MYVQGVSTRKVKAVTETLGGHGFSASAISAVNKSLDAALVRDLAYGGLLLGPSRIAPFPSARGG